MDGGGGRGFWPGSRPAIPTRPELEFRAGQAVSEPSENGLVETGARCELTNT